MRLKLKRSEVVIKRVCGCVTHAVKERKEEKSSCVYARECLCVRGEIRSLYQADICPPIKKNKNVNGQAALTDIDKILSLPTVSTVCVCKTAGLVAVNY